MKEAAKSVTPIASLGQIAKGTLEKLSGRSDAIVGVIALGFAFSILITVLLGAATVSTNPVIGWALIAVCVVVAFLALLVTRVHGTTKAPAASVEVSGGGGDTVQRWSRCVPDPAQITSIQKDIAEILRKIRERTRLLLASDHGVQIKRKEIRANIFFPDDFGKMGYGYHLNRPTAFKDSDEVGTDDDFVLPPTLGATGRVFERGFHNITQDRLFNLPDWNKYVAADLKWMISIPIVAKSYGCPVGVLNIDCTADAVESHILDAIANERGIRDLVASVSELMDDLDKLEVRIVTKRLRS